MNDDKNKKKNGGHYYKKRTYLKCQAQGTLAVFREFSYPFTKTHTVITGQIEKKKKVFEWQKERNATMKKKKQPLQFFEDQKTPKSVLEDVHTV